MTALDVRIGRVRVRCHEAATSDPTDARALKALGMKPGDLLLQFRGVALFMVIPAADRAALADAIAPMGAAPPADLPDALRCAAHGVALCVEPGCSPGPGGGR